MKKNRKFAAILGILLLGCLALFPIAASSESDGGDDDDGGAGTALKARAVLLADTFWGAPASGSQLGNLPINGRTAPFPGQPVQGVSAVIKGDKGTYWAMADNGFGNKANSPDFLLRVYQVVPDFETKKGGSGTVGILGFVQFRDPDGRIPWAIIGQGTPDRLLTGSDFDIESIRQDYNGDFWVGDEFGPFLLHFDNTGRLLEAPFPLPGVKSPDHPTLGAEVPNLPSSRGFEGTAISPNGKTLYPTLEGALVTDPDQQRRKRLSEPAGDVGFCALILGIGENLAGLPQLHQIAAPIVHGH